MHILFEQFFENSVQSLSTVETSNQLSSESTHPRSNFLDFRAVFWKFGPTPFGFGAPWEILDPLCNSLQFVFFIKHKIGSIGINDNFVLP